MPSREEIDAYTHFFIECFQNPASYDEEVPAGSSIINTTISNTTNDPHAVPNEEAKHYYNGVPSKPMLIYRTHRGQSSLVFKKKELFTVFKHPLADLWNDGLWRDVVKVMETHEILFSTLDVVRFKVAEDSDDDGDGDEKEEEEEVKKPIVGPVTIWAGVPGNTPPTSAHNAAEEVLELLKKHNINDVNVEFRESYLRSHAGPRLFAPVKGFNEIARVIGPLTPALGVCINAKARPDAQGTLGLYLNEGGVSNRLLGLTCRHVLFSPYEANIEYSYHHSAPSRDVYILGKESYNKLLANIELEIKCVSADVQYQWNHIESLKREDGNNTDDAMEAREQFERKLESRITTMDALLEFQRRVKTEWSDKKNRRLGRVLLSPPLALDVDDHGFSQDRAVIELDRDKLREGFQGNKIDLGTKLSPTEFTLKCFPHPESNWKFNYPDTRLLSIRGVLSDQQMRRPSMKDKDGEPCLLVVKNGGNTGTTIGRATGVYSVRRQYVAGGLQVEGTSLAWAILNYDSNSDVFSKGGDSGAAIATINGELGGKVEAGTNTGSTYTSDITYATPTWVDLKSIKANGFPNAHIIFD